tara:strand:- start:11930 stop:12127 length:198 start_codon:yes stop_codon:yes gene_type:complete
MKNINYIIENFKKADLFEKINVNSAYIASSSEKFLKYVSNLKNIFINLNNFQVKFKNIFKKKVKI